MQETELEKENNWSEVGCVIRRDYNGDMIGSAFQEVNTTAAVFHRNITMKREKKNQISSPTLYLGIVLIKNNRLAIIFVMQETEFEMEKNSSEVKLCAFTVAGDVALRKVFLILIDHGAQEGCPRNGCRKGDSVCRNTMEIVLQ